MIITKLKPIEEILSFLHKNKKIFLIGCAACASKCQTGGEKEINDIEKILIDKGFNICGKIVLDTPCDSRIVRRDLLPKLENEKDIQILVLSCGSGLQTISSLAQIPIVTGLDTLFIGSTRRIGEALEYCSACGECLLSEFSGNCPVTRCPKGNINGPCGGVVEGKCEVNSKNECIWSVIFKAKGNIGPYKQVKKFKKNNRLVK
jgi:hypothetical protein